LGNSFRPANASPSASPFESSQLHQEVRSSGAGFPAPTTPHAANDGYFVPEQIWDRSDIACYTAGRPTGSAAPLNWAEGQYLRLAQSIDAGYNLDTPSVVKAKYRGAGPILGAAGKCIDDTGGSTDNGAAIQIFTCNGTGAQSWAWNSGDGTLRALNKCMDVTGGATATGTPVQLWDATAQAPRSGAGDSRAAS